MPIEELNTAAAFFAQDIEFSADRWESWYRVAQVYDAQLEEQVSWSAEKMNSNNSDLIQLQRSSIHCYIMAAANAIEIEDAKVEASDNISNMFFDFGMRMYASSRLPYGMEAFRLRGTEERYYSGETVYKSPSFTELTVYNAWRIAASLFIRALGRRTEPWM